MVPAGDKAKRLSSVNHTTETIHHHQKFRKTGKHLRWSLSLQACNFFKKRLQNRCYLMKLAKFLITLFFTEHLFTVTASVCSENLGKILVRNN